MPRVIPKNLIIPFPTHATKIPLHPLDIIHRDYFVCASIRIMIFADLIELDSARR